MDTMTIAAVPRHTDLPRHPDLDDPRSAGNGQDFFGKDGFTFGDVLDVINPLQHIPLVNSIYRRLTGDEISTGSRLAGGALFGGAIGFASAMVNSMVDDVTGRDVGEHVVAMFWPGDNDAAPGEAPAQLASAPQVQPQANAMLMAKPAAPQAAPEAAAVASMMSAMTTSGADPAYLAALPSRAQAIAAREATASPAAAAMPAPAGINGQNSTNVPSLSPAAMSVLIASLTGGDINLDDDDEENHVDRATLAAHEDPASLAAWQAAMAGRGAMPLATAP